jgi:hypothetical protein
MSLVHRKPRQPSMGGPRNTIPDSRPPQKLPQDDTVLIHDCFDQHGGETKPEDCGCARRFPRLEAASLIKHSRADVLVIMRNGKREVRRDSIVLRRAYVAQRVLKLQINARNLLPAILKQGNVLSFRKGIIRGKNGTAIELEMNRTDAEYWNNVLVQLGLSRDAGGFLKDAAWGMGVAASFTSLENFQMAPVTTGQSDIDPNVDAAMATEIQDRREGVRRSRHKVGAAGFIKGSGGLTYWDGDKGEIKDAPSIYSPGNSRDSDERAGESHTTTGQMNSKPETRHPDDTRIVPKGADDPDDPKLLDDLDKP